MTPPTTRGAARSVERRFVLLTALRWLPTGCTIPVTAVLMRDRGLSLAEIGVVAAALGVVVLALELPSGGLADAWGRRRVLVAGAVLDLTSLGIVVVARDVAAFVAAAALQGVFRALDSGPLEAWFVDAARAGDPAAPVERGLARSAAAGSAGTAAGALAAAALVAADPVPGVAPLVVPVVVAVALRAVGVVALVRLVDERRPPVPATAVGVLASVPGFVRAAVAATARHRALRNLALVELLWGAGLLVVELYTGPRLAEASGDPVDAVASLGVLAAAGWGASAVAATATGAITARVGGPVAAATVLRVAQGGAVLLMAAWGGPLGLAAGYLAFFAVHGPANVVHAALLHRHADARLRTTVLSVSSLMARAGGIGAAPALGALAGRAGTGAAFAVAAVLLAAAAPLYRHTG